MNKDFMVFCGTFILIFLLNFFINASILFFAGSLAYVFFAILFRIIEKPTPDRTQKRIKIANFSFAVLNEKWFYNGVLMLFLSLLNYFNDTEVYIVSIYFSSAIFSFSRTKITKIN